MDAVSVSETNAQVLQFHHRWKITNFAWLDSDPCAATRSPPFKHAGHEWQLHVYPNGMRTEDKGFVGIFLASVSCHESDGLRARFKATVINKNPGHHFEREDRIIKCYGTWGWNRFIERDRILKPEHGFLINDTVTIEVVVWVRSGVTSSTQCGESAHMVIPPSTLSTEMGELLQSGEHTDLKVSVGGIDIDVHKCVLALRSKVFRAMLHHDMQEKRKNTIVIDEVDPEVMKQVIAFIYTDDAETETLERLGMELMMMADKYELDRLRMLCEQQLSKTLTIENVSERLLQADTCHANILKARCLSFMCNSLPEVSETESYNQLCKNRPELLVDIVSLQAQKTALQTTSPLHLSQSRKKRKRSIEAGDSARS